MGVSVINLAYNEEELLELRLQTFSLFSIRETL